MKTGYSNILGDVVEASELDYGDCKDFQIVCPCCREAVFKKERAVASGDGSHFLSHYPATDADKAAECERRVARMTKEDFAKMRSEGRGQALNRFLSVIPDISINRFANIPAHVVSFAAERFIARPEGRRLIDPLRTYISNQPEETLIQPICASLSKAGVRIYRDGANSDFGGQLQRFFSDTIGHLMTHQARPAFTKLAGIAGFMCAQHAAVIEEERRKRGASGATSMNEELTLAGLGPVAAIPSGSTTYNAARRDALRTCKNLHRFEFAPGPLPDASAVDRLMLHVMAKKMNLLLVAIATECVRPGVHVRDTSRVFARSPHLQSWLPDGWPSPECDSEHSAESAAGIGPSLG